MGIVFDICKRTYFTRVNQEELDEKLKEIKSIDIPRFADCDFSDLNFRGVDLDGVEFYQCVLRGSCFDGASLNGASFVNCLVVRSSFRGSNMNWARIENSSFNNCSFSGCIMSNVSLKSSSFVGSVFDGAILIPNVISNDTDFTETKIDRVEAINLESLFYAKNVPYLPMACPDNGAFIGWKKCRDDRIVKLLIPEEARRSSSVGRKCRCDKAIVLEIQDQSGKKLSDLEVAYSKYEIDFVYKVGETVSVDDFCSNRWEACATGIHFFINRQEAVDY